MNDLISRQAAIDALHAHLMYRMGTESNKKRLDEWINSLPSAQPDVPDTNVGDTISRQAAIDVLTKDKKALEHMINGMSGYEKEFDIFVGQRNQVYYDINAIKDLPSVQPTLYGYKIEHLVYIARVMEKEGVTADYAVRTFDNMGRAIKMIIDEAQQKVEEALNG